ncbi:MAG: AraC family transcriptional regulator [Spirochaetota bacterium]
MKNFYKILPRENFTSLTHFGMHENSRDDTVPVHRHSGYEIFYFFNGSGTLTLSKDVPALEIESDDILITAPNYNHEFVMKGKVSYYWLGFHVDAGTPKPYINGGDPTANGMSEQVNADMADIVAELKLASYSVLHRVPGSLPVFRRIHTELDSSNKFADRMIYYHVMELFTIITRHRTGAAAVEEPIDQLREYIDAHSDSPITLGMLADMSGLTPAYVSRRFKEIVGTSPIMYVNDVRMERAKELLAKGVRVTEVSIQCGFDNIYYFSALFKKKTGMPPSQYAKKNR